MKYIYTMFGTHFDTDMGESGMNRIIEIYKREMEAEDETLSKNGFKGWYLTEFGRIEEVSLLDLALNNPTNNERETEKLSYVELLDQKKPALLREAIIALEDIFSDTPDEKIMEAIDSISTVLELMEMDARK